MVNERSENSLAQESNSHIESKPSLELRLSVRMRIRRGPHNCIITIEKTIIREMGLIGPQNGAVKPWILLLLAQKPIAKVKPSAVIREPHMLN